MTTAPSVACSSLVSWSTLSGHRHCQRSPIGFDEETPFRPILPSIGWIRANQISPQPCFTHSPIGCLPLPVEITQLRASLDESSPQELKDSQADPSLKCAMDRAIIWKCLRELIPLASTSHPEDNGIQCCSWINAFPSTPLGRIVLGKQGSHHHPQFIRNMPYRGQCLPFFLGCRHQSNRANQVLRCLLAGSAPPMPEGIHGCHGCPCHEHDDDLQIPR